jgi:DNA-directed RNA polymerase specialized sigma24 family protein
MERLAPDQRDAITAHVLEDRGYGEIAEELETSEAVVRKRVSRGLATMRQRMGMRR